MVTTHRYDGKYCTVTASVFVTFFLIICANSMAEHVFKKNKTVLSSSQCCERAG